MVNPNSAGIFWNYKVLGGDNVSKHVWTHPGHHNLKKVEKTWILFIRISDQASKRGSQGAKEAPGGSKTYITH